MRILALVSAFNEEGQIGPTIKALKKINLVDEIIVVDDGSTDATKEMAERAGAKVISLPRNVGKGKSLNLALKMVDYDTLLLVDGDLGQPAAEARKLLQPVLRNEVDMAIADFPEPFVKGGLGLVKNLAHWGIRHCTGLTVNEPLSGQRAIKKSVMNAIGKLENGFGVEVGLTIDTARAGYKIAEVSTNMSHSETGRNLRGFVHRGRQFWDVLRVIVKRVINVYLVSY